MLTLSLLLLLAAFICTIISAAGKLPLWVAVFILIVLELLQSWPR